MTAVTAHRTANHRAGCAAAGWLRQGRLLHCRHFVKVFGGSYIAIANGVALRIEVEGRKYGTFQLQLADGVKELQYRHSAS
jgi:hypothetical protein